MKKSIKNSVADLQLYFAQDMQAVDKLINSYITSNVTPVISELSNHLINAGGKRLRPLLTLAASDLCNYSGASHIKLAAAIEYIHTATLLHDDVVDESFQRRGKPTANILWDNQSSVLVGDYLFSKSFQLMVETGSLKVLSILADASSTISEGEILQLSAVKNIKTDESAYFKIIEGKTAALFAAATEVGAVISNVERKKADALANFGKALGISFQITDDLLDYVGSEEVLGKNIGDDFKEGKVTLPLIKAISKSSKEEKRFWREVINKGMQKSSDLEHALLLMRQHDVFDETRSEAIKWSKMARNYLDIFPESKTKVILQELTYFVVERII
ncbi:MAG: polyprenyl synthetase family protein [Rhodobacteraceae bacterium]|nr:polyprenyl synthetase family protein [Paracoccaceae bacterium]